MLSKVVRRVLGWVLSLGVTRCYEAGSSLFSRVSNVGLGSV